MEAIHEFEVRDMPVTVAVDARGESVHESGPKIWARPLVDRPAIGESIPAVSIQA